MHKRTLLQAAACAALLSAGGAAIAQGAPFKIGLILPMTGPFASTGRQIEAAAKLYMQQNGDTVAGKKVQLVVKDDTGVADVTKRLAQELIVNDKVTVLAGFGLTPLALATAPLSTQAKVPQVVMAAATATITEASPFIVRTSFTAPQVTVPLAEWAAKNGMKKVVTLVTDYGPGIDAETWFKNRFAEAGGQVARPDDGGDVVDEGMPQAVPERAVRGRQQVLAAGVLLSGVREAHSDPPACSPAAPGASPRSTSGRPSRRSGACRPRRRDHRCRRLQRRAGHRPAPASS